MLSDCVSHACLNAKRVFTLTPLYKQLGKIVCDVLHVQVEELDVLRLLAIFIAQTMIRGGRPRFFFEDHLEASEK